MVVVRGGGEGRVECQEFLILTETKRGWGWVERKGLLIRVPRARNCAPGKKNSFLPAPIF